MTMLCNRCELLFQECRPLAGVRCGNDNAPRKAEALPKVQPMRPASAWRFDHRTFDAGIRPILAADIEDAP